MKMAGTERLEQKKVETVAKKLETGKLTKAQAIRELFAGGLEVREISDALSIRYNHVYNTVNNEVLKHGLEVEKSARASGDSKKNHIIALLREGKSLTEVARETKSLYNYVWQVADGAGLTKKAKDEVVVNG